MWADRPGSESPRDAGDSSRYRANEPLPGYRTRDRDRLRLRELRVGTIAKPGGDAGRHRHCGLRSAVGSPDGSPDVAVTERPTPPATPRSTPFPTAAFAALIDDPVPEDVAAMFQAAVAHIQRRRGDRSHRDESRWDVERRRGQGGRRSRHAGRQPVRHRQRYETDRRSPADAARGGGRGLARRTCHRVPPC